MSSAWWGPTSAKDQFLRRLHRRSGHPFLLSFEPPFSFDAVGQRWRNVHQLAAVVEFYANFRDPWASGAEPLAPGDTGYRTVDFGERHGSAATIMGGGTVAELDGDPDLRQIIPNPANNPAFVPTSAAAVQAAAAAAAAGYPPPLTYLYDTLWLEGDTGRPSRTYRIMQVDDNAKTVTLDAAPVLGAETSRWLINQRPTIVVIDPLGPRARSGERLEGAAATVVGPDPNDATQTIVELDGAQSLARINAGFDTIYLPTDETENPSRPGTVYVVEAVDTATRRVTVKGAPDLDGGSSPWSIPAGVGGGHEDLDYNVGPHLVPGAPAARVSRGHDHYDGALFIVHRGRVVGDRMYRFTSYTSRDYGSWTGGNWQQLLSSLRGNARYFYSSYRSGGAGGSFRNYSLAIIDAQDGQGGLTPALPHALVNNVARDTVAAARYYFGTPNPPATAPIAGNTLDERVFPDVAVGTAGKSQVRFHRGTRNGSAGSPGTGSAGCVVSPDYRNMRRELALIYEREYQEYYGPGTFDDQLRKIVNVPIAPGNNDHGQTLYNTGGAAGLTQANYDDKLVGQFWLIRPDERPETGP